MLVRDAQLPADVAVGDLLATPVTGAYGHSMASNYNKVHAAGRRLRRADGVRRPRGRRETDDDLVRLDDLTSEPGAELAVSGCRGPDGRRDAAVATLGTMAAVRVGILGCGNVGAALVRLLDEQRAT